MYICCYIYIWSYITYIYMLLYICCCIYIWSYITYVIWYVYRKLYPHISYHPPHLSRSDGKERPLKGQSLQCIEPAEFAFFSDFGKWIWADVEKLGDGYYFVWLQLSPIYVIYCHLLPCYLPSYSLKMMNPLDLVPQFQTNPSEACSFHWISPTGHVLRYALCDGDNRSWNPKKDIAMGPLRPGPEVSQLFVGQLGPSGIKNLFQSQKICLFQFICKFKSWFWPLPHACQTTPNSEVGWAQLQDS